MEELKTEGLKFKVWDTDTPDVAFKPAQIMFPAYEFYKGQAEQIAEHLESGQELPHLLLLSGPPHPHAAQKPETLELSLFESRHSQQHV